MRRALQLFALCGALAAINRPLPAYATFVPGQAGATVLTGSTGDLTSEGGDTKVIFIYKSALYESKLSLIAPYDSGVIFDNWQTGEGWTRDLGYLGPAGTPIKFRLDVVQTGASFVTGVADALDHQTHAYYTRNFSDFGVGALPAASAEALAQYAGRDIQFVGFEDLDFFAYDYSELVVALVDPPSSVPEPSALGALAGGLVALVIARRRRA